LGEGASARSLDRNDTSAIGSRRTMFDYVEYQSAEPVLT
jgi:hypothetical protein